jgi:hypothetical protein
MRKKLLASLVATCAIVIMGVGPAGASAGTVTLTNEGSRITPGESIRADFSHFEFGNLFNRSCSTNGLSLEAEVIENESDPARIEGYAGPSEKIPCGAWGTNQYTKIANLDAGDITFLSDGTGEMDLSFDYTGPNGQELTCHAEGNDLEIGWFSDGEVYVSGGLSTSGSFCIGGAGQQGGYILAQFDMQYGGAPVEIEGME